MTIVDKAIELLRDGAKRVDFDWGGNWVSAYWVGDVLRIDVHGLKRPKILYGTPGLRWESTTDLGALKTTSTPNP